MVTIAFVILAVLWLILIIPIVVSLCTEKKNISIAYCGVFKFRLSFKGVKHVDVQVDFPGKRIFAGLKKKRKADADVQPESKPTARINFSKIINIISRIVGKLKIGTLKRFKPYFGKKFLFWVSNKLFGRFGLIKLKYCRLIYSHKDPRVLGMIAGVANNINLPRNCYAEPDFIDGKSRFSSSFSTTPFRILLFMSVFIIHILKLRKKN